MPGKPLASERGAAAWASLSLSEEGGFAGLRRGTELQRGALTAAQCKALDALVAGLPAPSRSAPKVQPDAQQLVLVVQGPQGRTRLVFDRADLPEEVDALLAAVLRITPLKPLGLP